MTSQAGSPASMDYFSKGTNTATSNSPATSRDSSPTSTPGTATSPGQSLSGAAAITPTGSQGARQRTTPSGVRKTKSRLGISGNSSAQSSSSSAPSTASSPSPGGSGSNSGATGSGPSTTTTAIATGAKRSKSSLGAQKIVTSSSKQSISAMKARSKSQLATDQSKSKSSLGSTTTRPSSRSPASSKKASPGGTATGGAPPMNSFSSSGGGLRSARTATSSGSSDDGEPSVSDSVPKRPVVRRASGSRRSSTTTSAAATAARSPSSSPSRGSSRSSSRSAAPSLASFAPVEQGGRPRVSKKRGKKQLKDKRVQSHPSGAPKRPPTSFGLFKHKLRKLKKGKVKFSDFNNEASKKWKKMTEKQKRPFVKRADELFQEFSKAKQSYYRRKMKRLRSNLGPEIVSPSPKGKRGTRRKIDRRRRSGKTNPFMLFFKENRESIKNEMPVNSTVTAIAKEIGKRWKKLPDEERQAYIQRARKAAKKSDERMSSRLSKGKDPYKSDSYVE